MPRSLSGSDLSDDKPCEELFIGASGVTPGKMKGCGEQGGKNAVSIISQMSQAVFQKAGRLISPLKDTHTHTQCLAHISQIILTRWKLLTFAAAALQSVKHPYTFVQQDSLMLHLHTNRYLF